jgi:hypothetical protein
VITTDKQVRRLLKLSKEGLPLSTLAVKAGMDVKTARKYMNSGRLPSQMKAARDWRTREDPFADIWPEVEAHLGIGEISGPLESRASYDFSPTSEKW